ncbi:MAG: hypothetical protein HQ516_05150 [Chlorobium sp.]|nr:hypothetical protein [Chlorobium phaeovibrioides]NQU46418.1 hypothetical protein [Chlorobium sp.]
MRKKNILIIGLLAALLVVLVSSFRAGAESESPAEADAARVDSSACVYPKEYMQTHHMQVLEDWKNTAAHEGPDAVHETADGRKFQKNLSTCLACHGSNRYFCFSCHAYANVTPNCWNCHISPLDTP